jgi:N-acetylglutamate synthase-like GNAT family acetyltransferase
MWNGLPWGRIETSSTALATASLRHVSVRQDVLRVVPLTGLDEAAEVVAMVMDHDGIEFRAAGASDFDGVMRLYRQMHPADPAVEDGSARRSFEAILASPMLHLLVLEREGSVIATTYLNVIPNLTRGTAPYAVIENVVVDEALRGTGLGKEVMAATLEAAWAAGCYKAMLMTGSKREATQAYYRACGFDPDAKQALLARPPRT